MKVALFVPCCVDAFFPSIVAASTATGGFNHDGDILRCVFFHSRALACLVGLFVTLLACVYSFTLLVVH